MRQYSVGNSSSIDFDVKPTVVYPHAMYLSEIQSDLRLQVWT